MIKLANAPCSWGVLEFDLEGEKLEYSRYLDELQETGYSGTELGDWGFLPTDPVKLCAELEKRSLSLVGAFVPVALVDPGNHRDGIDTACKIAALLSDAGYNDAFIILADDNGKAAQRTINAGRITPDMSLNDEQWTIFASGADRIAAAVKEKYHMRTVFHHHCAGYVETPAEVEQLLTLTNPNLLGLCLDMGHYRFGGGDPLEILQQYNSRIWHVHFKDCSPEMAAQSRQLKWDYFESVKHGIFCELGKGDVDFASIIAELKKNDYKGWITVEQDVLPGMGSPKECAQRNRDYLISFGL